MNKITCLFIFLVAISCAQENAISHKHRVVELSDQSQIIDNLNVIGLTGSKITILEGFNNYFFSGRGIITVKKGNILGSSKIALNLGEIIISQGTIQIVSDSITNKIGVLEGNIQIQYNGRKADVSNGKTALISDNDIIIKSSIQK